jgi:hypothetical protein
MVDFRCVGPRPSWVPADVDRILPVVNVVRTGQETVFGTSEGLANTPSINVTEIAWIPSFGTCQELMRKLLADAQTSTQDRVNVRLDDRILDRRKHDLVRYVHPNFHAGVVRIPRCGA